MYHNHICRQFSDQWICIVVDNTFQFKARLCTHTYFETKIDNKYCRQRNRWTFSNQNIKLTGRKQSYELKLTLNIYIYIYYVKQATYKTYFTISTHWSSPPTADSFCLFLCLFCCTVCMCIEVFKHTIKFFLELLHRNCNVALKCWNPIVYQALCSLIIFMILVEE